MSSARNTSVPYFTGTKLFTIQKETITQQKHEVKSVTPSESHLLPKPIVIGNFHQIFSFEQRTTFPMGITFFLKTLRKIIRAKSFLVAQNPSFSQNILPLCSKFSLSLRTFARARLYVHSHIHLLEARFNEIILSGDYDLGMSLMKLCFGRGFIY